jgi:hypothetical protein
MFSGDDDSHKGDLATQVVKLCPRQSDQHWPKNQESPIIRESPSQEPSLTTVLEKLKALDAQRAQLLDDAKAPSF